MGSAGIAMEAPLLRIRLLGELDLRVDGDVPLRLGSARVESLLAYLLLHRGAPIPRQHLAFLLWPDSTEVQARTNLRHLLHTLRRALPGADTYLETTKTTLRWRDPGPFRLDVAAFDEAVTAAEAAQGDDQLAALRTAASLYRGDLLASHYDDWVLLERERLRQRHTEVLERLIAVLEERGELGEAIAHAEVLVHRDPLREEPQRVLMRLHDARGDRPKALRVYHAYAATLDEELGVAPSPAARHAYEALLTTVPDRSAPTTLTSDPGPGRGALVGRATERSVLVDRWSVCRSGRAQLVVVTGEPGVGKTRLVEGFRTWAAQHTAAAAVARSYRAEGELAFGPIVAWLRSEAYRDGLGRLSPEVIAELVRLLPELARDRPGLAEVVPVTDPERRRVTFDALATALLAPAGPVLLVADDLHWADRDSLQFLHFLLRSAPTAPVLVLATARREELDADHPLTELVTALRAADVATEIELHRLSQHETALLAEQETGQRPDPDLAARLHAETEGNPLFVIEALRAGWTGDGTRATVLTPRVQAVIEARLDQLSPTARELVGLAATIGRAFTAETLAAASDLEEGQLIGALDELWQRRLVRDQGADAYDFSHDRIREVAYRGLAPAQRRRHHLRVAAALQAAHRDDTDRVSVQLAAHHEQAGDTATAVGWYRVAAATAQAMHAHAEALRLLDRGMQLLRTLPATDENRELELAYVTAVLAPLGAVEGYSSPRLHEIRARGLTLAAELGVEPAPPMLQSLGITRVAQGNFEVATRTGARLLAGDGVAPDDATTVQGEYVLGIAAYWNGQLETARRHFENAVSSHSTEQVPTHLSLFGLDPKVVCLSRLANTLWFLGHPRAAANARDHALAFGREVGHPHSLGIAHIFAGLLAIEERDPDGVRAHLTALEADPDLRMRPAEVSTATLRAFVDVLDGHPEAAIAWLTDALDATGEPEHAPGLRASMARVLLEVCRLSGDAARGLEAADRILEMGGAARVWSAEAHRLRAEFLAALEAPSQEAAAALGVALRTARSQGARAYELRALTSLVRLRRDGHVEGDVDDARQALSTLLAALPEATATLDGMDAVPLLEA